MATEETDMTSCRKKLIARSVLLVGIGVLVLAAITLQRPLRERYWIWKLESGTDDERLQASLRVVRLRSVKAIPALIEVSEMALHGSRWCVDGSTSKIIFGGRLSTDHRPISYIDAIRSILKAMPEPAEARLSPYLSDEREFVRAVAASILFEGTDHAKEYVSSKRVFENPKRRT